jgi:pimeloyl-ACP methyl ester carboxylesterase
MRKTIRIRGIEMVYDDIGTGDVVLLIHGQPFNRTMWRYQIDALSYGYRLIVPDLRGYGESGITDRIVLLDEVALDLAHLMAALNIGKAHIVGLSMGGQIAFELYRFVPGMFLSMTLADTDARAETESGYRNRIELSAAILRDGMEKFTEKRLSHFMCRTTFAQKPAIVAHVRQMMMTTSPEGSAAVQRGRAERLDYTYLMASIRFPVLLVVGDQDEFTPEESARYMEERIAGSELMVLKDCGHISNMEQAEEFNTALVRFLNRIGSK